MSNAILFSLLNSGQASSSWTYPSPVICNFVSALLFVWLFLNLQKAVDKAKEDALKRLKSGRDSSASSKAPSSVELTTDSHTGK